MSRRDHPPAVMRVTETGLAPLDRRSGELLAAHPVGSQIEVTLFRKPNSAYLRLLWAVVGDVYPNTDWPTADALMTWLKVRARHIDGFLTMSGAVQVHPRSLSTFDHDELIEFGSASMGLISSEIVPGLDIDALLRSRRKTVGGLR